MFVTILGSTLFLLIIFLTFPVDLSAQAIRSGRNAEAVSIEPPSGSAVSDGCTFWFDGDYEDCCIQHDLEYRQKGLNWRTRLRADNRLFMCITGKGGIWHLSLAPVMWIGVRIFGSDLIPLSSRNIIHKFFKRRFTSLMKRDRQAHRNTRPAQNKKPPRQ